MRAATLILALTVPLLAHADAPTDAAKAKAQKLLDGTWAVVAVSYIEVDIDKKDLAGRTVTFKGDHYSISTEDGVVAEWKVTFEPGKKPKWITLTPLGKTAPARVGIYELKGDTLKLAMASAKRKEGRPKEFKAGPGVNFVTLKRVKAGK